MAEPRPDPTAQAIERLSAIVEKLSDKVQQMDKNNTEPPAIATAESPNTSQPTLDDVPSARELRRDYTIGREVNRRLAELGLDEDLGDQYKHSSQRTRGKRSGAARTVQDTVVHDIDWPHFHIYAPPGAEPVTFERLSIQEFAYGFLHMVDQPDAKFDRQVMWDLLKNVMEDATEYPWENVRNFFWIVGSHVENDRMKWSEHEKIQQLRAKHAQKHEIVGKKATSAANTQEKLRVCVPFQKGQCAEKADHAGLKHVCAYCHRVKAGQFPHSEADCRRKNTSEQPKNE